MVAPAAKVVLLQPASGEDGSDAAGADAAVMQGGLEQLVETVRSVAARNGVESDVGELGYQTTWNGDEVIPLFGGPYDGAEIDPTLLFGGDPPERLSVGSRGPPWSAADYNLALDGDGRVYRFAGWSL